MSASTVRLEVAGGVGELVLARPGAANSIDLTLAVDLEAALTACEADAGLRALVVRGEGGRFSVGGDLKSFVAQPELSAHLAELTGHLHAAVARLSRLRAPTVAAVEGVAAGAGLGLAMACDMVVAGTSARFTMAYTGVGLSPDGSSSWFLPRLVGLRRAVELTYTNRVLSAAEAADWGLVSRVVPDDEVLDEARRLARTLADGPTDALVRARELLASSYGSGLDAQLRRETELICESADSPDGREGVAAFVEKRPPRFTEAEWRRPVR
jgi:2-(1,2-epoxy-1,2-dihydrophenyl)acetyl-CoA isomerase